MLALSIALAVISVASLIALPATVYLILKHIECTQTAGGTPMAALAADRQLAYEAQQKERDRAHQAKLKLAEARAKVSPAQRAMGN